MPTVAIPKSDTKSLAVIELCRRHPPVGGGVPHLGTAHLCNGLQLLPYSTEPAEQAPEIVLRVRENSGRCVGAHGP